MLCAINIVLKRHGVLRSPFFFLLVWDAVRVQGLAEFSQKYFSVLSPTKTSYDLRKAKEQGIVTSRFHPRDKRVQLYRLTPRGEKILTEVEKAVTHAQALSTARAQTHTSNDCFTRTSRFTA